MNEDIKKSFGEYVRVAYGDKVDQLQFEKIYDQFRPHFVAEHGEPERSFTSVVTFGNNCRRALKEVLRDSGIGIVGSGV